MARTWMMATALIAVTSCADERNYDQGSSCANAPNGVCPAADAKAARQQTSSADQQQTSTPSKMAGQPTPTGSSTPTAGSTPAAVSMTNNSAGSAMRERLTTSLDFGRLDATGSTLLHWAAARRRNTATLKFLLAQGVIDINKQNNGGNTALHIAARFGDYGGVQLLLNQPNIDKSLTNRANSTAYDIAVARKRTLIAALLAP